ncbi:MAG: FKBP-type peptidyl-prolyl cis-trans isomerase [Flavobacteriales bacterium]|nr:FKBP-type peptidyl-prolyl cis-trans isomerase [Flavobacteriales bacterium]
MNKILGRIGTALLILFYFSCGNKSVLIQTGFTTSSGIKYAILKPGKGLRPVSGQIVQIRYEASFEDGSVFESTQGKDFPLVFKLGNNLVMPGLEEGVQLMKKGAKFRFKIPLSMTNHAQKLSHRVGEEGALIYEVELLKIADSPKPFDVSDLDTLKMENGLKYIKVLSNRGRKAESFKMVTVHYTGFFEDGKIFDSSHEHGYPITFVLGKGEVIRGWEEMLLWMREGEKVRVIIPPNLAYGKKGFGSVPPNATLFYDIELIKVD